MLGQEARLFELLRPNPDVERILGLAPVLALPQWYLGAGGIAQSVWNARHGYHAKRGIKDYDLVYFDGSDLSYQAEDAVIRRAAEVFAEIRIPVEVRNQARVHLWYREHFGYDIESYRSSEDAIRTWPATCSAIGLTRRDGRTRVFAPFGLDDLLAMRVRPNKLQITREVYEAKVSRWKRDWPRIVVEPW